MSTHHCPRCGALNDCGMARGKQTCWCATRPASGLPIAPDAVCLCATCLEAVIAERQTATPQTGQTTPQQGFA